MARSNMFLRTIPVFGVDPAGEALMASTAGVAQRANAGRSGGVIGANKADPSITFYGQLPGVQDFYGGLGTATLIHDPAAATFANAIPDEEFTDPAMRLFAARLRRQVTR